MSVTNLGRYGGREGLANTNNGVESVFKKLVSEFLYKKSSKSIQSLLVLLSEVVMNHYDIRWKQKKLGIELLPSKSVKQKRIRETAAQKMKLDISENKDLLEEIGDTYQYKKKCLIHKSNGSCSSPFTLLTGKRCKHVLCLVDMGLASVPRFFLFVQKRK
jgi:hypothetical protein